jgi:hypothetical protein
MVSIDRGLVLRALGMQPVDVDQSIAAGRPAKLLGDHHFRDKDEIEVAGDMAHLLRNDLDKHQAVNATARRLYHL